MDNHIVTFLAFIGVLAIIAGIHFARRKKKGTGGSFSKDRGDTREK